MSKARQNLMKRYRQMLIGDERVRIAHRMSKANRKRVGLAALPSGQSEEPKR